MAINDVNPTLLILRTAEELKKIDKLKAPEWALFCKTGMSRERPPVQHDWWFIRSAAILRKVLLYGPVGTSKLRDKFGGKKNNGYKPEHFYPAGGNHIRKILQKLESAGLVKQAQKDEHKGRVITPLGHGLLDKVATGIMKEQGIVMPKKPDVKLDVDKPKKAKKPAAARKRKPSVRKKKSEEKENGEQQA